MCPAFVAASTERQQLQANISGYQGYENKEERSQSDLLLRAHLRGDLKAILTRLATPPEFPDHKLQQKVDQSCASVRRKLSMLSQSLEQQGDTAESFFNRDRLPAKLLLRLYQHELSMLNSIAFLSMEINSVPQQTRIEQVEEQFAHIQDLIDTFNQGLFEREALIAEYAV